MKIHAKHSAQAKLCMLLSVSVLLLAGCSGSSSSTSDAGGGNGGGGAVTGVATPSKVSVVNTN